MSGTTRVISTRLMVDGLPDYKRQVKEARTELKALQAEEGRVKAEYQGQRHTLEALIAVQKTYTAVLQQLKNEEKIEAEAVAQYTEKVERLEAQYQAAQEALEKYNSKHKREAKKPADEWSETHVKLAQNVENYGNKLRYAQRDLTEFTTKVTKTRTAILNKAADIQFLDGCIKEATENEKGYTDQIDENGRKMTATAAQVRKLEQAEEERERKRLEREEERLESLANAMVLAGAKKSIQELYKLLKQCVDAAIEFESAIAGVAKTTDFTDSELAVFASQLQELSTQIPITTTELAAIAENAGQLGIADQDILEFTEVMANLGVSTSMSAEEAATALAQLASITGMSGDNYDRLGSTIVALGNNFATTESRISDMSKNIAAAAVNADMSETDILALSAAVTSLGIEAGYGGTAISKLLQEMQAAIVTGKGLEEWAAAAGMSAREFARLWGEDAASAVLAFISNMGTLGEQMTPTLQTLGIGEARITRVIQSLANAEAQSGTLTNALNLANTAWEENNALTIEAQKRYDTTESKLILLGNAANYLATSIGQDLTPAVNVGIDALSGMLEVLARLNETIPVVSTAIGALAGATIVGAIPFIIQASKEIAALQKVLEILGKTIGNNKWVIIIGAVVGGLMALTSALDLGNSELIEHMESLEKEREQISENVEAAKNATNAYEGQALALADLLEQEEKSATDKALILSLVEELNAAVPNLNVAYDEQADKLYSLATGAEVAADAVIALAEAEGKRQFKNTLVEGLTGLTAQQAEFEAKLGYYRQIQADLLAKGGVDSGNKLWGEDGQAFRAAHRQIQNYEQALEDVNEQIREYKNLLGYVEAEEETSDSVNGLTQDIADLTEAYEANRKAAAESLAAEIKLFDEMETEVKSSFNSITEALQSQLEWQNNYREAVNNLMARDIDGMAELIDKITEVYGIGSQEAYDYIMSLSGMSDEEIADVMEMMSEVEEGQKDLATTLGEAKTVVDDEMQGILDALDKTEQARNLGQSVGEAYITALRAALAGEVSYAPKYTGAGSSGTRVNMTHAQGLDYVPYDDYLARLHEGEMVLNRAEARAYRAAETASSTITNATTVNIYPQNLSNAQIDYIYRKFNAKLGGAVS